MFPTGIPSSFDENTPQAIKDYWLSIFIQLSNSSRFSDFVNKNFFIGTSVDEETKSIETQVVETPVAFGPTLELTQIAAIRKILGKDKTANKKVEKILEVLGQEDVPQIEVVSSLSNLKT
jgi:hypothetical protein